VVSTLDPSALVGQVPTEKSHPWLPHAQSDRCFQGHEMVVKARAAVRVGVTPAWWAPCWRSGSRSVRVRSRPWRRANHGPEHYGIRPVPPDRWNTHRWTWRRLPGQSGRPWPGLPQQPTKVPIRRRTGPAERHRLEPHQVAAQPQSRSGGAKPAGGTPRASAMARRSLTVANRDLVAASAGALKARARPRRLGPAAAASGRNEDAAEKWQAWATSDRSGAARRWRRPLT
jgi:hypothetical protein